MDNAVIYKYKLRPGYKSGYLLLEFINGVENETFTSDLLNAIDKLNPRLINSEYIWINDEILLEFQSDFGNFTLTKDNWNIAFIMAEDNQHCINKINSILQSDLRFEKVVLDNDNYK